MLPKETLSICPNCNEVIEANIYSENGEVWIEKECEEHGYYKDIYWSDKEMYERARKFKYDGRGIENPQLEVEEGCPYDCGLCDTHYSHTSLANIDLTNRCNLNCSFCFAHAKARGYVYEPSFEEVVDMLKLLRNEKPVPTPAVQFSGGEPTLRDDLTDIVEVAKDLGFNQVQIATNGIKVGENKELPKKLKEAGLSTLYLHFDGTTEEIEPHLEVKKKAIDNCRKAELGIVLVPTVIDGRNDDQVADILEFAVQNIDIVRGVNFQPVAFTGAAEKSQESRFNERFTIPDLVSKIEDGTGGQIKKEDFYPVPSVVSISKAIEAFTGKPQVEFSSHPNCGVATYIFVTDDGFKPINRFVDVDAFFENLSEVASDLKTGYVSRVSNRLGKSKAIAKALRGMKKCIDTDEQPEGLQFRKKIKKIIKDRDYSALGDFHWNSLFVGSMHFQDSYNYDLERIKRCVIHYATPDGRIIPFCAYNSGPTYRKEVEEKFSIPIEEWEDKKGKIEEYGD